MGHSPSEDSHSCHYVLPTCTWPPPWYHSTDIVGFPIVLLILWDFMIVKGVHSTVTQCRNKWVVDSQQLI